MINITKSKISSLFMRQALLSRQPLIANANVIPRVSTSLLHTSSFQQKSIIEKAKDLGESVKKTGHDVNLKMGQELAHGIDEAEAAIRKTPSAKQVGDKVKQAGQEAVNKTSHAAGNLKADTKAKVEDFGQKAKETVEEQTHFVSEQLQKEKEQKMTQMKEQAEKIRKTGEGKVSEGVDRVEDAIHDTSEKLGAKAKEFKQDKHRLEDEVEDAVQRLQHKRD